MKNYTKKKKHKENERKERGKGEEKGTAIARHFSEERTLVYKAMSLTGLTSECGY